MRIRILIPCLFIAFQLKSQVVCDSVRFKISGSKAKEIAEKEEYLAMTHVQKLEVRSVKDSCRWYILMAQVTTIHHGYYSTTYHEYEIDAMTGKVVKSGGFKKLGEKVPNYDKDYRELQEKKKKN